MLYLFAMIFLFFYYCQVEMLMLYVVQTTNLTFVGEKIEIYSK